MLYGYIYKIENLVNGKLYIGQTTLNYEQRKWRHFYELRRGKHSNEYLQNSFNKHGEFNFDFKIITWGNNQDELNDLEIYYINKYDCLNRDKGYNLREGGQNGKMILETKIKISESLKGNNNHFYGKKHNDISLKLMSSAKKDKNNPMYGKFPWNKGIVWLERRGTNNPNYGRPLSTKTRQKISESIRGKNNPMYGKKHSPETIIKMSNIKRGRGLFGFTGTGFIKKKNPEKKCWTCRVSYNMKMKSLGLYEDPLSAEIIHDLVFKEIIK